METEKFLDKSISEAAIDQVRIHLRTKENTG